MNTVSCDRTNLCLVVTVHKDFECHAKDPPPFLSTPNGTKKKRVAIFLDATHWEKG